MTRNIPTANRRNVLKGLGGTVAAAGLGGAALLATTGGASATLDGDVSGVTITSDDGTVDYVAIYGDSTVTWDGFETPAQSFDIVSEVEILASDGSNIAGPAEINTAGPFDLNQSSWGGSDETHSGVGTSGTISSGVGLNSDGTHDPSTDWAIVQASDYTDPYGLPANPVSASYLEVDSDGATASYTVRLYSTYTWYENVDGTGEVFSKEFVTDIPVTVENVASSASTSSGSGTDGATGA